MPVVAGLIEIEQASGIQFAMRIGEHGEPVILPLQAASQHIMNVRESLIERLRIAGERL